MKRTIKALVAAVAGVALLTGVGGTFAKWSQTEAVTPGAVTAGHLAFVATGSWSDVTVAASPVPITDISTFRMVPGDIVEYRSVVTPDLEGDNLSATLTADLGAPTGSLVDGVAGTDVTVDVDVAGGASAQVDSNTADVPITVTIEMPVGNTGGEDESVDLSSLTISLDQN